MNVNLGEAVVVIKATTDRLNADLSAATSQVEGFTRKAGRSFQQLGHKIAQHSKVAFASLGASIVGVTKVFGDFEKGFTNVSTLLDPQSLESYGASLRGGVLDAIRDFGFSIDDANRALFDSVSAGVQAGEASQFLREASRLASGGVTDLGVAVDGMTSVLNAYSLESSEATRIADAFFTAQKFGKTTVADLASNIGKIAPVATQAGISYQSLLAMQAQLTLSGLSTEEATTSLRAAISALVSPAEGARKVLEEFGVPVGASEVRAKGFRFALERLSMAAKQNPDVIAQMIPNIQALTAISALGEAQLSNLDNILHTINTDYGENSSLTQASEAQLRTFNTSVSRAMGSLKVLAITIGEKMAPFLSDLADKIAWVADRFNQLSPATQSMIAKGALLTTAIAGVTAVLAPLALAVATVGTPVLAATAAIGGIASAIAYWDEVLGWIHDKWKSLIGLLGAPFKTPIEAASKAWGGFSSYVSDGAESMYGSIKHWLGEGLQPVWNTLQGGIETAKGWFYDMYDAVVGHSYVPDMVDEIGEHIARLDELMVQPTEGFTSKVKNAFEGISSTDSPVESIGKTLMDSLSKEVKTGKVDWSNVLQPLKSELSGIFSGLFSKFGGFSEGGFLHTVGSSLISGLGSFFGGFFAGGGSIPAGKVSVVGEKGPELFIPRRTGTIIPNKNLGGGASGTQITQNIHVTTGVQQTVRAEIMRMLPQIRSEAIRAVGDASQRGGSLAYAIRGG